MIDGSGNILHPYPGGIITVAGAKKKIPAMFSRPWQSRVPYPNPKCPFHRPDERTQAFLTETDFEGEQWFVLDSLFAPEKPHRLIIPDNCWDDEEMRHLGGWSKIEIAIKLAAKQFARESEDDQRGLWGLSAQIGPLAAQNVPHCHYHLYKPNLYEIDEYGVGLLLKPPQRTLIEPHDVRHNEEVVVFPEKSGFEVVAGGQFTGQLFLFPNREMPFTNSETSENLSRLVHELVELYAKKFRSIESLAPDYRWEFEIHDGKINFGIFIPKLNNTGTLEDMTIIDGRRGMNLLWSHEETARYLRSE